MLGKKVRERTRAEIIKKYLIVFLTLNIAGGSGFAFAANITVSGNPAPLIINSATAGSQPLPVTDSSTTYDIDVPESNKKITGETDTAMPPNTYLKITLEAPAGATSAGQVTLSTTSQDLVTGLSGNTVESGLGITYEYSATVDAGVVSSSSKTVTLTITDSF